MLTLRKKRIYRQLVKLRSKSHVNLKNFLYFLLKKEEIEEDNNNTDNPFGDSGDDLSATEKAENESAGCLVATQEISDTTNPFGDESNEDETNSDNETLDESKNVSESALESTNPFGEFSDSEEEKENDVTPGNPFGSDHSDEDESNDPPGNPFGDPDEKKKAPPRPPAPKRPPPPKTRPRKKQAPLPPSNAAPFDPNRPHRYASNCSI